MARGGGKGKGVATSNPAQHNSSADSNYASSGIYPTQRPSQDKEDIADGINHLEMNPRHLIESAILFHEELGIEASRQDFIEFSKELASSLSTRPRADESFRNLHKSLKSIIKESSEDPNFRLPNLSSYLRGFLGGASGSGEGKDKQPLPPSNSNSKD